MSGRIKIIKGDLTDIDADAIVNPANSLGYMGGGVAGAIRRKGGEEIEREAVEKSPIPIGKAIATNSGRLKCRYVIHAPTMERPAMRIDIENVKRSTEAAFRLAKEMGLKRIAMPGMGTGVGGVEEERAAEIMVKIAEKYLDYFDEILFVDINDRMIDAWKKFSK